MKNYLDTRPRCCKKYSLKVTSNLQMKTPVARSEWPFLEKRQKFTWYYPACGNWLILGYAVRCFYMKAMVCLLSNSWTNFGAKIAKITKHLIMRRSRTHLKLGVLFEFSGKVHPSRFSHILWCNVTRARELVYDITANFPSFPLTPRPLIKVIGNTSGSYFLPTLTFYPEVSGMKLLPLSFSTLYINFVSKY